MHKVKEPMGPSIFATDRPLSRHQEGRRQRGEGRGRRLAAKVLFHLVLPCSIHDINDTYKMVTCISNSLSVQHAVVET